MISSFRGICPKISESAYVADCAQVIGSVCLKENTGIWHNAVLRGDMAQITIGAGSNVQDNCTLHCDELKPLVVGENVTIGHNAILHSCTVGDCCIIGMGAIVLNDVCIGSHCLIAAGSVLTPRTVIPDGSLVMGSPAKVKRELTEEEKLSIRTNAQEYIKIAKEYK
jgi:carbonic anhydrase/acetyltransferase-like protein (isoleucine patch superfamily)